MANSKKQFLLIATTLLVNGCATEPPVRQYWVDISGARREDSQLQMASGACGLVRQQALAQAEAMYPEDKSTGYCPNCGVLRGANIMLRAQNVKNYADTAYFNCMKSQGWELRSTR